MRKNLLVFVGLILLSGYTWAQVSVQAQVFAEVITSNTATETAQLNFGKFSPGPNGGQIIISPQGFVSTVGTVVLGTGAHNAASFSITGDSEASFTITLPSQPVVLTQINGPKTMQVINWKSYPDAGSTIVLQEDGTQIVFIGATLEVGNIGDNPKGLYSGNYSISFEYN